MSEFCETYREAFRGALRPHPPIGPVEWAERYRSLPERGNAEPGPFRFDRRPYLRGILEALHQGYNDVVLQAPVQCGKSEAARTWLGHSADLDPGPAMLVFPSKEAVQENVEERIIPMFRESPRLRKLLSARAWDTKKSRIALTTCTVHTGYAGSPQALATRPIRRAVCDEINNYPRYTGKIASPVDLVRARVSTYEHRGQVLLVSTPTIPSGPITVEYEGCADRRTYQFPCAACGEWSEWDWERVQWEGRDSTDDGELRQQRAGLETGTLQAVYSCEECGHLSTDEDRPAMVGACDWVSDGHLPGTRPESTSVGFRLTGLAVPATSFSRMALEYVKARLGGIDKLQYFYNNVLGLPFWGSGNSREQLVEIDQRVVQHKAETGKSGGGRVPEWAACVLVGADPGKTGAHYVVRAFGQGYRSTLLEAGHAESLRELADLTLKRAWTREGGGIMRVTRLAVDVGGGVGAQSRSRADEVYRWAKSDPARIYPIKGWAGSRAASVPALTQKVTYHPPGVSAQPYDVTRTTLDVTYFADLLAQRVMDEDELLWAIGCSVSPEYLLHLCAETKRLVERRHKADGEIVEVYRWVPRVAGAANHWGDCERYVMALAHMIDMDRAPSPELIRDRGGVKRRGPWRKSGSGDSGMPWRIGR